MTSFVAETDLKPIWFIKIIAIIIFHFIKVADLEAPLGFNIIYVTNPAH
jgi:hypothetical protein